MGNSRAYPVFRTTDAAAAYAQARRLCALLERCDDEVGLMAELNTVEDVRRMAELLPGARYEYVDPRTDPATGEYLWCELDVTTADDAALQAELPLEIMEDIAQGSVEDLFVPALGRGMAGIDWSGRWPDDPDAECHGVAKYDGVQVVFHGDQAQWGRWTEHHTVFVHVDKWGDLPRARKLAAHIGSEVLGEEQLGW
ncbi:hypothetical protein [Streptomyces chryseus]|uniref:Uncharacterized protein n=1 Tax=Streptomyces chryseus TaxID=68186 RepID=A0ABQ3DRJ3_9ACTN|nr:hypothetical protein [Streptomyces chryseus]GHB01234.1 hypothetical protein GCM10010346_25090 [Streptomyces chryseus]